MGAKGCKCKKGDEPEKNKKCPNNEERRKNEYHCTEKKCEDTETETRLVPKYPTSKSDITIQVLPCATQNDKFNMAMSDSGRRLSIYTHCPSDQELQKSLQERYAPFVQGCQDTYGVCMAACSPNAQPSWYNANTPQPYFHGESNPQPSCCVANTAQPSYFVANTAQPSCCVANTAQPSCCVANTAQPSCCGANTPQSSCCGANTQQPVLNGRQSRFASSSVTGSILQTVEANVPLATDNPDSCPPSCAASTPPEYPRASKSASMRLDEATEWSSPGRQSRLTSSSVTGSNLQKADANVPHETDYPNNCVASCGASVPPEYTRLSKSVSSPADFRGPERGRPSASDSPYSVRLQQSIQLHPPTAATDRSSKSEQNERPKNRMSNSQLDEENDQHRLSDELQPSGRPEGKKRRTKNQFPVSERQRQSQYEPSSQPEYDEPGRMSMQRQSSTYNGPKAKGKRNTKTVRNAKKKRASKTQQSLNEQCCTSNNPWSCPRTKYTYPRK